MRPTDRNSLALELAGTRADTCERFLKIDFAAYLRILVLITGFWGFHQLSGAVFDWIDRAPIELQVRDYPHSHRFSWPQAGALPPLAAALALPRQIVGGMRGTAMNRGLKALLMTVVVSAACTLPAPIGQTQVPTTVPTAANTPTPAPTPTRTPNPFPNPVLKITGAEEVVFDWTTDRCEALNLPDLPTRAFRGADGQVQLILSHFVNYRMIGPDLDHLQVDCHLLMGSQHDADPSRYADSEWIASPYTEDGQTIYAVVHNEYHGWEHPGQCSQGSYYPPCWYNTLTLAVSKDGGQTYAPAMPPPGHFVAGLPYQYERDGGPAGLRNSSNLIKGKDGYYYQYANVAYIASDNQGVCLMRAQNLADPTSWRFWDGSGFNGQFVDSYLHPPANPDEHTCDALEWENIGASLNDSISFNTYLGRYVLLGLSADQVGGREVWGFYYSFSDDLIHWTHRKLLAEMVLPWTAARFDDVMYLYPSLLDPDSDSRNFETTDNTAYLYYTRHNQGQGSLDRDLIRVPVEFFPSP